MLRYVFFAIYAGCYVACSFNGPIKESDYSKVEAPLKAKTEFKLSGD